MNLDFERMIVIPERKRERLNYRFLGSCRTKQNVQIERVKRNWLMSIDIHYGD